MSSRRKASSAADRPGPGSTSAIFSGGYVGADRSTLSDKVANQIASDILRGGLEAGVRLPTEHELCDMLGVSRSVIRDAVRTLAARGLVQVRQGVGTVVTAPDDRTLAQAMMAILMRSDRSVGEVLDARSAIETQIAAMAAAAGQEQDWSTLDAELRSFSDAVDAGAWQEAYSSHLEFHLGILRSVHIPVLELILAPMQQLIMVSSLPARGNDASAWEVESHAPILDALRAGNPDVARGAMERHFAYTNTAAYRAFRATPFREVARLESVAGVSVETWQPFDWRQ